jgi:hypothetical protein
VYILGSVLIAVMCAIKHSAIEVACRNIIVYIQGNVHIAAMCAIKHSAIEVA